MSNPVPFVRHVIVSRWRWVLYWLALETLKDWIFGKLSSLASGMVLEAVNMAAQTPLVSTWGPIIILVLALLYVEYRKQKELPILPWGKGINVSERPVQANQDNQEVQPSSDNQDYSDWLTYFEAFFVSRLDSFDFRRLWASQGGQPASEPVIEFIFNLKNNTPFAIQITGVTKGAAIDNDLCIQTPNLKGSSLRIDPFNQKSVRVEQPVSYERGRSLIDHFANGKSLAFSLSGMRFTGEIETLNQTMPEVPCGELCYLSTHGIGLENYGAGTKQLWFSRQ